MDCYGYLRVSGKDQIDGDGFPRQRLAIETYASAYGFTVIRWFEEQGISGTKDLENRPALQDLILSLRATAVKTVIIEKLDRFARDLMIQETIIADMRASGFELISVCEPDLCSDDPSRVLVRQVFGAIAQYDRAMLVLKLKSARDRIRANSGKCEGRKPFGYTENEQSVIRTMIDLRASGSNDVQIAHSLNEQKIRPRKAATWSSAVVGRILDRLECK